LQTRGWNRSKGVRSGLFPRAQFTSTTKKFVAELPFICNPGPLIWVWYLHFLIL
jgi:hypothetical protein